MLLIIAAGCGKKDSPQLHFREKGRTVPEFKADSAYHFIQKQLSFGPRNPNSRGHQQAKKYFTNKFSRYAGPHGFFLQNFTHQGYNSDTLRLSNIIASFNPQSSDRIMLCAHWDSRPRADQDDNKPLEPIMGADDGASGVAVLMELARLFSKHPPPVGVDLILFDGEDYGKESSLKNYFLGSRYWAQHQPVKNYAPRFGILLDMVGGRDAQFPKEKYSMRYAPALVNELWEIAAQKNLNDIFVNEKGSAISDDHLIIDRILSIPTIDIVRHKTAPENGSVFADYWHTHDDRLNIISKKTLQAVGDVLTELIYNRI